MNTTITIKDKRVEDLLCSAFEGGSTYWAAVLSVRAGRDCKYTHEFPLKGGSVTLYVKEDEEKEPFVLDKTTVQRGLDCFATVAPKHFGDWLGENDDAVTGDVFLQLCLFGEVRYG